MAGCNEEGDVGFSDTNNSKQPGCVRVMTVRGRTLARIVSQSEAGLLLLLNA